MGREFEPLIDIYQYILPSAFVSNIHYMNAIAKLKNLNTSIETIIMISRYAYNYCEEPLLDDKTYDFLLNFPQYSKFKEQTYEEDDYSDLIDLIKSLGLRVNEVSITPAMEENPISAERKNELISKFPVNTSLRTLTSLSEVRTGFVEPYQQNINIVSGKEENPDDFDYYLKDYPYQPLSQKKVFLAYKHDGWNITAYYIPEQEEVAYAHTRGRGGASTTDCTFLMQKILPKLKVTEDTKVVMEVVVDRDKLLYLRSKYLDKSWVNIRNSVSTFIAGHVEEKDYNCVTYKCFNISNSEFDKQTILQKYNFLIKHGFQTPMCTVTTLESLDATVQQMDDYYMEEYSKKWECDGIVMTIDSTQVYIPKEQDINKVKFSNKGSALCAYKGGSWDSEILETEIESIYLGRSKKYFTPKAKLKPVRSRSGSMIKNVGLNNLALVQKYWLMPGDTIKVKYHSQQIVLFVDKVSGMTQKEYIMKNKDKLKLSERMLKQISEWEREMV